MEGQNIINSKHENLRRAIEVPSIALKNLKSCGSCDNESTKVLKEVITDAAKELKKLINNK